MNIGKRVIPIGPRDTYNEITRGMMLELRGKVKYNPIMDVVDNTWTRIFIRLINFENMI